MTCYNCFLSLCFGSLISLSLTAPLEPVLECPMPYREVYGRCLFFDVSSSGPWHDMESICQDWQGHLAKINDANLLHYIVKFINDEELTPTQYWIGATDEDHEGDWQWIDGTKVTMGTPYWGTNSGDFPQVQEPSSETIANCAAITRERLFYFHDWFCSLEYVPICEHET